LVIGGNRGLSGPYNANINKKVDAFLEERSSLGVAVEPILLGKKPAEYFRRKKRSFSRAFEDLSDYPNDWPTDEVCKDLEVSFLRGEIDEAYIVYTRFKSAISMSVMAERLLPMDRALFEQADKEQSPSSFTAGKKIFEPSVDAIFSAILPPILRARIRQACLDAKASEYGSRMTAMDAATKNAGELSEKLKLKFNNLRQANITSELLDILGGSEAVK
jgi:F-type H+-transporting ATPase subunit gamma